MAMPGWASPRPQSLASFSQLPTVLMQLSLARGAGVNSLQRLQPVCQQQQLPLRAVDPVLVAWIPVPTPVF